MVAVDEWDHRWFGVWSEYGSRYYSCPSVHDFVNKKLNAEYPIEKIVSYIRSGHIIATTSRLNFPDPFDAGRDKGSISYRTDGKWLWLDDLADYVQANGVCIPEAWLLDMQSVNFVSRQDVPEAMVRSLEWPPVI